MGKTPIMYSNIEQNAVFIGLPEPPSTALQEAPGGSIVFRLISDKSIIIIYWIIVDNWHLSNDCTYHLAISLWLSLQAKKACVKSTPRR